jgi:xanthine dehydrogenase accessory factor
MDWLMATQRLREHGLPGVLVTVIDVRGHAPREAGAKMLVGARETWDSVGGGNLEATVVERGRAMIAAGTAVPERLTFGLTEHAVTHHGRQCCGGVVEVLLEPLPPRPTVAVFGVGHVGHELARILSRLPLTLYLVDSRAEQVDAIRLADVLTGPATVKPVHSPVPDSVVGSLPEGSRVYIMSHDHAEDFLLCDAALRHDALASIGLIGSSAKWARFRRRLVAEGHSDTAVDRISCPIGSPDITGKEPAVIAVSVAAELLRALHGAPGTLDPPASPGDRVTGLRVPGHVPA